MKLPSKKTTLANVVCLATLLWLYGGGLLDAVRARSAEVSAFLAPPPMVWPAVVLAITVGVLGVSVWGVWRGQPDGFKGYRLLPIVLVCSLFFELVLLENQVPLSSKDVATMSLGHFEKRAQALADGRAVPSDPTVLQPLLEEMGQPPYLVRGTRAQGWSLQVRQDCQGPVAEAPGLEVGTFIYCVAPGRDVAWVTLVGLPGDERFGQPAVLSNEGVPYGAVIVSAPPEEEQGNLPRAEPFEVPSTSPGPEAAPVSPDAEGVASPPGP